MCHFLLQVTSVVTSFVFRVLQSVAVNSFVSQLMEVGFLIHWESLLSTHGDEIGMLEDFIVAIHDLNTLKFKVHVVRWGGVYMMNSSLIPRPTPALLIT